MLSQSRYFKFAVIFENHIVNLMFNLTVTCSYKAQSNECSKVMILSGLLYVCFSSLTCARFSEQAPLGFRDDLRFCSLKIARPPWNVTDLRTEES